VALERKGVEILSLKQEWGSRILKFRSSGGNGFLFYITRGCVNTQRRHLEVYLKYLVGEIKLFQLKVNRFP